MYRSISLGLVVIIVVLSFGLLEICSGCLMRYLDRMRWILSSMRYLLCRLGKALWLVIRVNLDPGYLVYKGPYIERQSSTVSSTIGPLMKASW